MHLRGAAQCCSQQGLLDPLLGETVPLLFFTLAVVLSAIRGGFGPGIFSTFLGALLVVYFFPPKGFFFIARESLPAAARELAVFFVVGVILSWLGGKLRQLRLSWSNPFSEWFDHDRS
jgi:K+-sensing histidine kinase KdpD